MIDVAFVKSLVDKEIENTGMFIVELNVSLDNKILVELDSEKGVGIDDCVRISRAIEENLDREKEDFELQVSSAGIDQPLRVVPQYIKNIGREVEILLKSGIKLFAVLTAADDKQIEVEYPVKVPIEGQKKRKQTIMKTEIILLSDIKSTKIVISF